MFAEPTTFPAVAVALPAGLALLSGLAWMRAPSGGGARGAAMALGISVIAGHLAFNGMNYVFPPSSGIDWLPFLTVVWLAAAMILPGERPAERALPRPAGRGRRLTAAIPAAIAAVAFFLCQARLPWLFSPEESGLTRAAAAAGVVAGGLAFCGGQAWLASMIPPAGFWLSQLALTVPVALHAGLQPGPAWVAAIHWLLPAVAAGSLGPSMAVRGGRVSPAVAVWCGVTAGFPVLWSAVSRVPAADPGIPLLFALIPGSVAAIAAMVRACVHPAGLALAAAAGMLLGATAVIHVSPAAHDDGEVIQPGDDSGAYG